jgi:hypothetical protein
LQYITIDVVCKCRLEAPKTDNSSRANAISNALLHISAERDKHLKWPKIIQFYIGHDVIVQDSIHPLSVTDKVQDFVFSDIVPAAWHVIEDGEYAWVFCEWIQ